MTQRVSLKDIDISLEIPGDNSIKGRMTGAESATVTITADDTVAYEGGSYLPTEIIDGKVAISGSIEKAWINNDFFKSLFPITGTGAYKAVLKPSFTLKCKVANAKTPKRAIELYGVKFNSANVSGLELDSYSTQSLPFNATGYKFLD